MDEVISLQTHKEFVKRMDDANEEQMQRIRALEEEVREIREIQASIKELTVTMKGMTEEQKKQGERLEVLEGRDGEMWRKAVSYVITTLISLLLGFVFAQAGLH